MAKNPKHPQDDADLRSDGVRRRAAPSYSVCSTGSETKDRRKSRKPRRNHTEIRYANAHLFGSYYAMARTAPAASLLFECTLY